MKIVKIKNDLMFRSNDPNGFHYYGFWWNKQYGKYNAVQLTHIARKDIIRYNQADNGTIQHLRIKALDKYADSGIKKNRYISDVRGNPLNPNIGTVVVNKLSTSSANKIKNFGTTLYSRGRKI